MENGLSHNTVWCGLQDNYGFIWLGTDNGLNCYNGNSNIIYRNMLNDKLSFESNFVKSLFEEGENIYIGANFGLYRYNRYSNHFSRFNVATRYGVTISSEVKKIIKTKNGLIWICTLGQGFFIYNTQNGILRQNSVSSSYVCDICQGNDRKIYLSTMQGTLLCFNENGKYEQAYIIDNYTDNKSNNCVQNINGEIWIGAGSNLLHLNKAKGYLEKYNSNNYFGLIHCLLQYTHQGMLLGTDKGLYLFNFETKIFYRIDNPSDPRSLSDQTINSMMWDLEGSLWVFTNLGGVNYMPKQSTLFNYYNFNKEDIEKVIGPFCETTNGNIWIGTQNGLYFFNPAIQKLTAYNRDMLKYDIRTIMQDNNKLWIGTYSNGIRVIDLKSGNIKSYIHSEKISYTICSNDVNSIYKNKKGVIYIGTNWGLCYYDPVCERFITIRDFGSMTSITDILEDSSNNLWVATSNFGVFCWNIKNKKWKHYTYIKNSNNSITSNSVTILFKDAKNTMWFGTNGGGICSFNTTTETFTNLDPNNTILPNSVINSIEQDSQGNLWISSNAGLTRVNLINKTNIYQYTVGNELWGGQLTQHSSLKSSNGNIYFGSINGFYTFNPKHLGNNLPCSPIYITNISFPYSTNDQKEKEKLNLDKPLYTEHEIKIPYKDNSFIIHFIALNYNSPSKNRYSYILKGVDKQWVLNTEGNVASYTNLPPGKYEFLVRIANSESRCNQKTASLWIIVTPPWYRSNIAYLVYFILSLVLIYITVKKTNKAIHEKYNRRMEEYEMNQEKKAYKSKIKFFINLVHEMRTPLSLMSLPLEKMQEIEQGDANDKYISIIHKNLNYLLDVTNQLLDFQKLENNKLQLNIQECNINNLVINIYNQFSGYADLKNIELKLSLPEEEVMSSIDREKITKILVNLMSNAFKYAQKNIELGLLNNQIYIELYVKDDGPGIPDSEKNKIFEAFYQSPDDKIAATGTGIGLSFAKLLAEVHHGTLEVKDNENNGSMFILSLPINKSKTKEQSALNEIISEKDETQSISYEIKQNNKDFTILLVEDNIELLNLTFESLQKWYHVLKAQNGREAVELVNKESVDIIISDVMMPEMGGLELCNIIKSNLEYSHIPVILLTAKTTIESKIEGLQSGADVYLEKPFSIKQLHLQIENLLKLRINFYNLMASITEANINNRISSDYGITPKDCEFTEKLKVLLAERLADENFSIDSLADQLNMSRSSFYRKIKALSGISPNDYMKTIRMNRAAELIKEGIRISEVAQQVGFTSSSYFAKCFKNQFGVLPKDYLNK